MRSKSSKYSMGSLPSTQSERRISIGCRPGIPTSDVPFHSWDSSLSITVENISNRSMASSLESKVVGPQLPYDQQACGIRARLMMFDRLDGCLPHALSGVIVARHDNQSFYEYCDFSV